MSDCNCTEALYTGAGAAGAALVRTCEASIEDGYEDDWVVVVGSSRGPTCFRFSIIEMREAMAENMVKGKYCRVFKAKLPARR